MFYKENTMDNELVYIDLQTDEGDAFKCLVIATYEAEGNDYIALAPVDENDEPQEEIFIYGYVEHDEGYELLSLDDDEFDIATEALEKILEEDE